MSRFSLQLGIADCRHHFHSVQNTVNLVDCRGLLGSSLDQPRFQIQ